MDLLSPSFENHVCNYRKLEPTMVHCSLFTRSWWNGGIKTFESFHKITAINIKDGRPQSTTTTTETNNVQYKVAWVGSFETPNALTDYEINRIKFKSSIQSICISYTMTDRYSRITRKPINVELIPCRWFDDVNSLYLYEHWISDKVYHSFILLNNWHAHIVDRWFSVRISGKNGIVYFVIWMLLESQIHFAIVF